MSLSGGAHIHGCLLGSAAKEDLASPIEFIACGEIQVKFGEAGSTEDALPVKASLPSNRNVLISVLFLIVERARPKGSRDPLGFEMVWIHFGRRVVG